MPRHVFPLRLSHFALGLALAFAHLDAAGAQDTVTLLARAKLAAGGAAWDPVRALHTRARLETGGLSGPFESWTDVATGRFVDSVTLGPAHQAEGYDGKAAWTLDPSGQTHVDDSGDGREGTANQAYLRSLSYWYAERRPGAIEPAGTRSENGRSFEVLRLTPQDGRPLELWVDAATGLIDRTVEKTSREVRTTYFSDYRPVAGLQIPFRQRSTNGEARYDLVMTVESVEINPALPPDRFRKPAGQTADFAIAGGRATADVPFELVNNHILVTATFNGKPATVMFDTGGANMLTPAAAERLGLSTEGKLQARGVGEKSVDFAMAKVAKVELGASSFRDQVFYVLPLTGLDEVEGRTIDGLLGFEYCKRFVVRVDYEKRRLTVILPDRYTAAKGGTVVPFTFDDQTPQVEGEIDGLPGRFSIDTGSRSSLTVHRPFAEAHDLATKYRPKVTLLAGWGVGGGVRSAVSRAKLVKLGGVAVPAPVIDIPVNEKGSFTNPYLAGNVGGGILKRFTVTFDYPHQTLTFEPNGHFADPDEFDHSGLWLNQKGKVFEVKDVAPESPGAQAGLEVGDEVTAIDGRPAADLKLWEVREKLRGKPGTEVRLRVVKGGAEREAKVVLRDLI